MEQRLSPLGNPWGQQEQQWSGTLDSHSLTGQCQLWPIIHNEVTWPTKCIHVAEMSQLKWWHIHGLSLMHCCDFPSVKSRISFNTLFCSYICSFYVNETAAQPPIFKIPVSLSFSQKLTEPHAPVTFTAIKTFSSHFLFQSYAQRQTSASCQQVHLRVESVYNPLKILKSDRKQTVFQRKVDKL